MLDYTKPVVLASRCLGGEACRWDGSTAADNTVRLLREYVEFRWTCPELEIGLGVPRLPIHVVSHDHRLRLIQVETGIDLSETMVNYCQAFLDNLEPVDGIILKGKSPSCGLRDVKIYQEDGRTMHTAKGAGFLGRAVLSHYKHLPIMDEEHLQDQRLREHFLTRLFTQARFHQVLNKGNMRELVRFHTDNKLLFMAYNRAALKRLGNIIANVEKKKVVEVLALYANQLVTALAHPPRQASVMNTLIFTLDQFANKLSAAEKASFLESLAQYRSGQVPLSVCIGLVQQWNRRFRNAGLQRQTFLYPYPVSLTGSNA